MKIQGSEQIAFLTDLTESPLILNATLPIYAQSKGLLKTPSDDMHTFKIGPMVMEIPQGEVFAFLTDLTGHPLMLNATQPIYAR
jgi:hypothetical protein